MSGRLEPSWRAFGASVRGSSHETLGTPCQDAHAIERPRAGWIVLAVADGAGSAAHSEIGAGVAVRVASSELAKVLHERVLDLAELRALLPGVVSNAREAVLAEANQRSVAPNELASTLLVAVCSPALTISIHVGDGAIVVARHDGTIWTFSPPEPSEHPNETTFLTSREALSTARICVEETAIARIALMSDGLQNVALCYPRWEPFAPFFDPLFQFVGEANDEAAGSQDVQGLLGGKKVRAKSDDDVTLIVAGRVDLTAERYTAVAS